MGLYINNKYGRETRVDLPDRESEEWNKFNDELGEKMRGVGLIFEKYCKFTPDVGEGVHLLDD